MPPLNQTPEVNASAGVLAQVTMPLAEAGYYVLPVAVTNETFKQNGMSTATMRSPFPSRSCARSSVRTPRSTSKSASTAPSMRCFTVPPW